MLMHSILMDICSDCRAARCGRTPDEETLQPAHGKGADGIEAVAAEVCSAILVMSD